MIEIRKSTDRGYANHGWLETFHTFSFANYYDPARNGFRALRVINEDRIAPGTGFPPHGHSDMEIVTVVLEGALEHRDSLGNGSVIGAFEVQRMTAGRGVSHSEVNHSRTDELHLLQIWILPNRRGLEPGYEQKSFADLPRNHLCPLVTADGREETLLIHQDVSLYSAQIDSGSSTEYPFESGRHGWLQVTRGGIELNGIRMSAGDGAAISGESRIRIEAVENAGLLFFDLA